MSFTFFDVVFRHPTRQILFIRHDSWYRTCVLGINLVLRKKLVISMVILIIIALISYAIYKIYNIVTTARSVVLHIL